MTEQECNNKYAGEMTFKDFIVILFKGVAYLKSFRKVILISIILGTIAGGLYSYIQKPVYTANLTFVLEDEKSTNSGLAGALGLANSLGIDIGTSAGGAFNGQNLIELMMSRTLVEKALLKSIVLNKEKSTLADFYLDIYKLRKAWQKNPRLNSISFLHPFNRSDFSLTQDSVLGIIYEHLVKENLSVVQKDKKTSIITVEVKSIDENFSKLFVEYLTKEVSEFYIITKSSKAQANVLILERQADSIRKELNFAIAGVASSNDQTYNLNPALNIKRVPSSKRQIDVQANTVILTELVKNLELARVSLRKETPLIQVIDKPILPLKKTIKKPLIIIFTSIIFFVTITISGILLRLLYVKHIKPLKKIE